MTSGRVEQRVLEALAARSPLHVIEISDHMSEHPVSVDLACARLHDNGDILPVGLGRYDITEQGQRRREEHGAEQTQKGSTS